MSDDKRWGRGTWNGLQIIAAGVDDLDSQNRKLVCSQIRFICSNLPCENCVTDAMDYINANPPENAANLFIWVWTFHNVVNKKLHRPEMSLQDCKDRIYRKKISQAGLLTDDWGIGTWNVIHLLGVWADSPRKMELVCSQIRRICECLPNSEYILPTLTYINSSSSRRFR